MISSRKLFAQGEYATALKESQQVLYFTGPDIPRDEALFFSGMIYAHAANPGRNDAKALASLQKLIRDYPQSPLGENAKIMIRLLQENEQLDRTVKRLHAIIIELQEVDIGVDQKRREISKQENSWRQEAY
jgi:outer membrane protein assembly factor BamD (BamD/ComL family)